MSKLHDLERRLEPCVTLRLTGTLKCACDERQSGKTLTKVLGAGNDNEGSRSFSSNAVEWQRVSCWWLTQQTELNA